MQTCSPVASKLELENQNKNKKNKTKNNEKIYGEVKILKYFIPQVSTPSVQCIPGAGQIWRKVSPLKMFFIQKSVGSQECSQETLKYN